MADSFWVLVNPLFPNSIKEYIHISIAGSLTVGSFSIGAILSLYHGMSASLCALIIATQPIVVAFLAFYFLNEKMNVRVILGLLIGFVGVAFVVVDNFSNQSATLLGLFWAIVSLSGLSIGTIYQKKHCSHMNLFSGGTIQTLAATLVCVPFLFFEDTFVLKNDDFTKYLENTLDINEELYKTLDSKFFFKNNSANYEKKAIEEYKKRF